MVVKNNLSQQTNHYFLGKKELGNQEIYSITQDLNSKLYIATNKGVIRYNGYDFTRLSQAKNVASNSFFNLKTNTKGEVFCSNLFGQVLHIKNDSLLLYFEEPEKQKPSTTYYTFTKSGSMLVLGRNLHLVKKNNSSVIYNFKQASLAFSNFFDVNDNTVGFFHGEDANHVRVEVSNDSNINLIKTPLKFNNIIVGALSISDTLIHYDLYSRKLVENKNGFIFKENSKQINNEEAVRYFSDGNRICMLNPNGGLFFFSKRGVPLYNNKIFLNDHFISSFYKDQEGNYLLGTFNKGIIIIPNLDVSTYNKDKIFGIDAVDKNLFASSQKNEILKFSDDFSYNKVCKINDRIVKLVGLPKLNLLLIDANKDYVIDTRTSKITNTDLASIKDAVAINDSLFLVAADKGLILVSKNKLQKSKFLASGRTNIIDYNPLSETVFYNNVNGLHFGKINNCKPYYFNGEQLIANDINYKDGITYVASKKRGIFLFKGDKLIDIWKDKSKYNLLKVLQIETDSLNIYFRTDKEIIKLNLSDKNDVTSISSSSGFYTENITDIAVHNNNLISISPDQLQKIDVKLIKEEEFIPSIEIAKIIVNDNINTTHQNQYNYQQSKFEFILSSPTLKYKDELVYNYKLEGIDNTYQTNSYNNNKLIYKSIPPGSYKLIVNSKWRNNNSKKIVYAFTITPPYWNTWWFYLIIALLFLTAVLIITQKRIKRIKKKNELKNELNLSKLIAIQSQMNPHFIFNAINSIQDLILEEKTEESYDYVVKFSQLVRQTLSFSNKEFINFEDEISLLRVYLEIEKLRFKDDFSFVIETNNIGDILLPPMLIQPFVENAIKHGLLHKKGKKELVISFQLKKTLKCIVKDNGIGRDASSVIKNRQKRKHNSFSTSATATRLVIMNEHYEQEVFYNYKDIVVNDIPQGTEVTINMPYKES